MIRPLRFETNEERLVLAQAFDALIEDIIWPTPKELAILIRLRDRLVYGREIKQKAKAYEKRNKS